MHLIKKIPALSVMLIFTFIVGCASTETQQSTEKVVTTEQEQKKVEADKQAKIEKQKEEVVGSDDVANPGVKFNPAPNVAFDTFSTVIIEPVTVSSKKKTATSVKRARRSLEGELKTSLQPLVEEWARSTTPAPSATLIVKTDISSIRIVSGATRFWGGAFAGRSTVLVKMTLIDQATNEVIATPEFYRHSNAFGAAWSYGAADRSIIPRAAELILDYFEESKSSPVLAPTGR